MEQEVRKTKRTKTAEPKLAFDPAKVFDLGQIPDPQPAKSLEDIAREEAELDRQARIYRARHGQAGDRSGDSIYYFNNRDYRAGRGFPQ